MLGGTPGTVGSMAEVFIGQSTFGQSAAEATMLVAVGASRGGRHSVRSVM